MLWEIVLAQSKRRIKVDSAQWSIRETMPVPTSPSFNAASISKSCTCSQAVARESTPNTKVVTGLLVNYVIGAAE